MRKTLICVLVLAICTSVCAMCLTKDGPHDFESQAMLSSFYNETESSSVWDSVTVSVLTASKSDPLYSWFGHAGLVVRVPGRGSYLYDWGRFSFGSDFYLNFIKGRLWYTCSRVRYEYQLSEFADDMRTVSEIELNLTSSQKQALVEFLDVNTSVDYRNYLYHHYQDNCATRIRDLVDRMTDGDFRAWAESQSGLSYRQQVSRILHNSILINWILDFAQGPSVDLPCTLWDEMFLPSVLEKALLSYPGLAKNQDHPLDFRSDTSRSQDYETPQSYLIHCILFSAILTGLVLHLSKTGRKKLMGAVSGTFCLMLGVLGSILLFMMVFTRHDVTYFNENILFINPLLLVYGVRLFCYEKKKKAVRAFFRTESVIICILLVLKAILPSVFIQQNLSQIITVLPLYLALSL